MAKKQVEGREPSRKYERISFQETDVEIMDLVLDQVPELRICAGIVREARKRKLTYPMTDCNGLVKLLPEKNIVVEGHNIRPAFIKRYMSKEYFPIDNERELITRCYTAFMRCKDDVAWAMRAPSYAQSLLDEVAHICKPQGGE